MKLLFLIHLMSTLCMTGIIWFVQVVHYPLFAEVGQTGFARYELLHQRWTGWVVAPLMLIELGTAIGMIAIGNTWPHAASLWIGLGLLLLIWGSTFFIQVPLHTQLGAGSDEAAIRRLVRSNWIRTIAWTLRMGLICWWLWERGPNFS